MHTSTFHGLTCLIVEDEAIIGMDIEDALEEAGYQPLWVVSAEHALASINDRAPDVAIIDIRVRDGSCFDVAYELMRRNIPFIVHSGSTLHDISLDLMKVTWIAKPAQRSEILNTLNALLQQSKN